MMGKNIIHCGAAGSGGNDLKKRIVYEYVFVKGTVS